MVSLLVACSRPSILASTFLERLAEKDASELAEPTDGIRNTSNVGYAATFLAFFPAHLHKEFGDAVVLCEAIWTNGFCLLSQYRCFDKESGQQGRFPKAYTQSLHNVAARRDWTGAIFAGGRSESRHEAREISAINGSATFTNLHVDVTMFAAGDRESISIFDRFCWLTGRGYAHFLNEVITTADRVRLMRPWRLEASGDFSTWRDGRWVFALEPDSYLVREARFTPKGAADAALIWTNSGNVECPGLSIARSGSEQVLDISRSKEIQVISLIEVLSLTNLTSAEAVAARCARILERMNAPVPPGRFSRIVDYRGPHRGSARR